jgi:predicted HTH transcriptional regulator
MAIDFEPTLLPDGTLAAFESKTLEYKRDLSSPDRVMRALVAFANSAGGSVVVGVADDHSVVGVADPLVEENRLANLVMNSIAPTLVPEIEILTVDGKQLLVAKVYPAGQRPFHVTAEGPAKGVYVRLGSSNIQADKWIIADLRRQSEGLRFDQMPNAKAKSGLDDAAIAKAFPDRDMDSAKHVLELVVEDQGKSVPTNGGVLLFGKDREHLFPDAWVYCGRFRGADGLDLTDTLELYANLLDIPDLVEAFLKKHAFKGADMREWRRKDDWSVPLDILREAVVNALIHSDYTQQGGPIRVAFYDDHVYIESLGGLLPGMTVESMRAGMSRIRNQVIARAFREAGMIEQWGYGVQRMFRRAAELGLDEPSYVELPGRLRFIVPTRHAAIMTGGLRSSQLDEEPVDSDSESLSKSLSKSLSTDGDPARIAQLLRAARAPISRADLLAAIGIGNESRNAARHIEPLIAAGWLTMSDPNNPRRRSQRYLTTNAGLEWLAGQG